MATVESFTHQDAEAFVLSAHNTFKAFRKTLEKSEAWEETPTLQEHKFITCVDLGDVKALVARIEGILRGKFIHEEQNLTLELLANLFYLGK